MHRCGGGTGEGDRVKLWVDDLRDAPDDTWAVARTYDHAVRYLGETGYDKVSLRNHDLSAYEETGYDLAVWMTENLTAWPRVIAIHTANPIWGAQMYSVLRAATLAEFDTRIHRCKISGAGLGARSPTVEGAATGSAWSHQPRDAASPRWTH